MIKNAFGREDVLTYQVDLHTDVGRAYYGERDWLRDRHSVTIMVGQNRESHRVFFDHMEIERRNLRFGFQEESLAFEQRFGDMVLGLHMLMDHSGFARGSVLKGDKSYAADFRLMGAHYTCKVGISEELVGLKAGGALYYDLSSEDKWNAIPWLDRALEFCYSVKPVGKIGKDPLYETAFYFHDNATGNEWTVKDNPIGTGECVCSMEQKGKSKVFTMSMKSGKSAKADDRSALPEKERAVVSLFPEKFSLEFDGSFYQGKGAYAAKDAEGNPCAYAVSLVPGNPNIVGAYRLSDSHFVCVGKGRLMVDGAAYEKSRIIGNRLVWEGLSGHDFLAESGSILFSEDGERVVPEDGNALGGERCPYTEILREDGAKNQEPKGLAGELVCAQGPELTIYGLLNMDPVMEIEKEITDADGNKKKEYVTIDVVQDHSMSDFYALLKYCMPQKLFDTYIGGSIHLDPEIVGWLGEEEKQYFRSLSVPYLANALGMTSMDGAEKLNRIRASNEMNRSMAESSVYGAVSKKLYKKNWSKTFGIIELYLQDQKANSGSYAAVVDGMRDELIAELEEWKKGAAEEERKHYDEAIEDTKKLAEEGKREKYWAFVLYHYLITYYFPGLFELMIHGGTSQNIAMEIKKYSALLEILDESDTFNNEFVAMAGLFQLAAIMPSSVDHGQDMESYFSAAAAIIESFLKNYMDTVDEDIRKELEALFEAYGKDELRRELEPYFEAFSAAAESMAPGMDFASIAELFEKKAIEKIGKGASAVVRIVGFGIGAAAIGFCMTGKISWKDFDSAEKATIIAVGSELLGEAVLKGIRNGLEAHAYYLFSGSRLKAIGYFLKPFGDTYADAAVNYQSSFCKWMLSRGKYVKPTQMQALFDGALSAEDIPAVSRIFGRNLDEFLATRFSAALAIVGIVLSAIEVYKSAAPLERDMNIVFLSSGCLDLVATAAGWVGGLAASEMAVSACAWISGLAAGFGIALALAGLGILIYMLCTQEKPKTPMETFIDDYAKDRGFYNPYGFNIDDFAVADSAERSMGIGISVNDKFLCMKVDAGVGLSALDYSYRTVFFSAVDEKGRVMFMAADADVENAPVKALTAMKSGSGVSVAMEEKLADKELSQKWIAQVTTDDVEKDARWDEGRVVYGPFVLQNALYQDVYLSLDPQGCVCGGSLQTVWRIGIYGTKPYGLSYNDGRDLVFYKDQKDQRYAPAFRFSGSAPLDWSIEEGLAKGLSFSKATGIIAQVNQEKLEQASKELRVEAVNGYGSAETKVNIVIQ